MANPARLSRVTPCVPAVAWFPPRCTLPMTVSKLLEALPNELIDQILCYVGQLERLDRRPSAYGVLSRVNRRLHTLALPHLFSTTILPVRKAIRDEYALSPAPLARFIGLLASNPMYKQHIRCVCYHVFSVLVSS